METCGTCNLEEGILSLEVPCGPCAPGDNVLHELHVWVEDTASLEVTYVTCGQGECTPSLVETCGTCDDLDEWQEVVEDSPLMEVSIP